MKATRTSSNPSPSRDVESLARRQTDGFAVKGEIANRKTGKVLAAVDGKPGHRVERTFRKVGAHAVDRCKAVEDRISPTFVLAAQVFRVGASVVSIGTTIICSAVGTESRAWQ